MSESMNLPEWDAAVEAAVTAVRARATEVIVERWKSTIDAFNDDEGFAFMQAEYLACQRLRAGEASVEFAGVVVAV